MSFKIVYQFALNRYQEISLKVFQNSSKHTESNLLVQKWTLQQFHVISSSSITRKVKSKKALILGCKLLFLIAQNIFQWIYLLKNVRFPSCCSARFHRFDVHFIMTRTLPSIVKSDSSATTISLIKYLVCGLVVANHGLSYTFRL
jgi:hypothetical protein